MSDPLSVASSAVGIISLGLQLCSQIVSYCQAWQGCNHDVQNMASRAEGLRTPLKKLRELIEDSRLTDPMIAGDLEEKALSLQHIIQRLEKKTKEYTPVGPKNTPDKFRVSIKKAGYFFQKDVLRDMINDLDGIQIVLQTTLDIFSAEKMMKLGTMQEKLFKEVHDIRLILSTDHAGDKVSPALLRLWYNSLQQNSQLAKKPEKEHQSEPTTIDAVEIAYRTNESWSVISRRSQSKSGVKAVAKSYRYYSRLLSLAVIASFSLSTGAGGFSITPSLQMRNVLAENSWQGKTRHTFIHLIKTTTTISDFERYYDDLIYEFQEAFTKGQAAPSDAVLDHKKELYPLVDFPGFMVHFKREYLPSIYKLANFLLSSGSVPNNSSFSGVLRNMCRSVLWKDEDYRFASQLVSVGGPMNQPPWNWTEKRNMQYILSKNEEWLDLPDIIKVILRESGQELRDALNSGRVSSNDKFGPHSLLEITIGWPEGIKILLEAGADASQIPLNRPGEISIAESEDNYHSTKLLLQSGCKLGIQDIARCKSRRVRSLLIQELAARRERLWKLAQLYLSSDAISQFGHYNHTILDLQTSRVYAALIAQGRPIEPSLKPSNINLDRSVYHFPCLPVDAMEEMYQLGFQEVDVSDLRGITPLMESCVWVQNVERSVWMVSKGANPHQKLPHSDAAVAHCQSAKIVAEIIRCLTMPAKQLQDLKHWKNLLWQNGDKVFLHPFARDGCDCACCPNGCTSLSVALRQIVHDLSNSTKELGHRSFWFRQILQLVVERTQSRPGTHQAIIRSLTFDGLGLKHTCCIEIQGWCLQEIKGRDKAEIREIWEEQKQCFKRFEQLVLEFEAKFVELGQPIIDFLADHWHIRMIEFLSHCDPYNQDHHKKTRSLGVFLEKDRNDIPDVVYLVSNRVKESG